MSGRAPRRKGNKFEREAVALFTNYGLDAKRVPLSGAARGFKGDVIVTLPDREFRFECKIRRKGFAFFYEAIGDNDAVLFRTDREQPLVVMPLWRLAVILSGNSRSLNQVPSG